MSSKGAQDEAKTHRPWFYTNRIGACGDRRWLSLVAGIMMEAAAGSAYAFGLYSNDLKLKLGLTQHQLQSIGAIGNIGFYTSAFTGGPLFDAFGPWVAGAYATVGSFVGYYLMYSGASESAGLSHAWIAMALYAALWQNASSSGDTVAISTQVRNFPKDRGLVMGVLKAFFGLSAIMIAVVYTGYFKGDAPGLLRFLSVSTPSLIAIATACQSLVGGQAAAASRSQSAARGLTEEETEEIAKEEGLIEAGQLQVGPGGQTRLYAGYALVILTATFVTVTVVLQHENDVSGSASKALPWVLVPLLIMVAATALPLPWFEDGPSTASAGGAPAADGRSQATVALLEGGTAAHIDGDGSIQTLGGLAAGGTGSDSKGQDGEEGEEHGHGDDFTVWGALATVEFWLLFLVMFIGVGSGLTVINNIGQMTLALSGKTNQQAIYVSVLAVGNCAGRMLFGFLSDLTKKSVPRPVWIAAGVGLMGLACLVCAVSDMNVLFLAVILVGLAYGSFWTLSPSIIADVFGGRSFGMIYSISSMAPAGGSYAFAVGLASTLYQQEIGSAGGTTCYGHHCFRGTFLILAALCLVAAFMGLALAYLAWGVRGSYPLVGPICGVHPAERQAPVKSASRSGLSMAGAGGRAQGNGGWEQE